MKPPLPRRQLAAATRHLHARATPRILPFSASSYNHTTTRNASYTAPASNPTNPELLKRRYQAKPSTKDDATNAERAQYMKRMRWSAVGLAACALGMYGAINAWDVPLPVVDDKKGSVIQNESIEEKVEGGSGVLEQAELVATGTSTIPFFPRTVHLSDKGGIEGEARTIAGETLPGGSAAVSTGLLTPPPSPGGGAPSALASTAGAGVEYQLLGLGIRTVSFLGIQVYVVGLYVASPDIATLQERLIRTIDPVATTLVPGEKQKLRDILLDPVKSEEVWGKILADGGIRTAFRIVPTRNTDFMHMRDGFVRGITGRVNTNPQSTMTEAEQESFGKAMNDFKAVFGGGSRKKIPYGQVLYLLRDKKGLFEAVYEESKGGVREHMGAVAEERVSRLLWLNYLAGKNVSSEDARKSVVEGCVEWCGRPVGTVAAQVV